MGQRGYGAAEAVASCRITASPCWREGASCRVLGDRSLWSMPHASQSASHRAARPRAEQHLAHTCGQLALSGRLLDRGLPANGRYDLQLTPFIDAISPRRASEPVVSARAPARCITRCITPYTLPITPTSLDWRSSRPIRTRKSVVQTATRCVSVNSLRSQQPTVAASACVPAAVCAQHPMSKPVSN